MDKLNSNWISQTITSWLSSGSSLFIPEASTWLHWLAIAMLVGLSARWTLEALAGGSFVGVITNGGLFLIRLLTAIFCLYFYSSPMPWGGVSFSGLIPHTANQLAGMVDQSATQNVLDAIGKIEAGAAPSVFGGTVATVQYYELLITTLAMRGLMFLLSTGGFIAVGVAVQLGPLSIPFMVVPSLSWLWRGWLAFMIGSSMFQVVAAVVGALWSNILLVCFNHFFHGDFSVVDVAKLLAPFVCLNLAMAFTCLGVGAMTAALYGGAAASLGGFGQAVFATAKRVAKGR